MREYLRLLRFVKPYLGTFILAIVCMGFSAVFDGVSLAMIVPLADKVLTNKKIIIPGHIPLFLSNLVDKVNNTSPVLLLNYMAVGIVVLFFFKGIFSFLQSYLMSDVGQKVVKDIRLKLYEKMQALSLDYFTQKRGGELISRITNDVKLVENAVSYGSTDIVYQTLQVLIFLFLSLFIYFKLAVFSFIMVPAISLPIIKVGKILRKLSRRSQEKMADINSILYETILGTRIIKAFNMEGHEINKFTLVNRDYYRISMKSIKRLLLLSPATEFIGCLGGIFVFLLGGKDVIAGKLSFGVFGLFMASLLSLIRPFKKLSQVHSINQQAMAASQRIHEVLDTLPTVADKPGARAIGSFKSGIEFRGLSFNYGNDEVLQDINLSVRKGEVVALVGPSGGGKTTLADLIPRFYDPQKGAVLIDNTDIRDLQMKSLRSLVGIVSQETFLFNDSIRGNIVYGRPEATQEEIEQAARQAYAHDFIKDSPSGYSTVIGDRGMKLSGGERQRIAIARALLKNPPILILDEATSQLDTASERIVQEALEKLMQGRTVFIIAHRLSTVRSAERIIVLEKGRIVEQGSHEALLNQGGLYSRLYQMQELEK